MKHSEQSPHVYSMVILEHHLDAFGHVNNATYLQILEQARWDFITSRGYGLQRIQETSLGPVVLEMQLKFRHELVLRQQITIETCFARVDRKLAVMHQEIKNEKGQVCFLADLTFGIFDLKRRKLVTPDPEWRRAIDGPSAVS